MAIHVDHVLDIEDLPRDCIHDCSSQSDTSEAVEHWRRELDFTVDRDKAITCLKGYGSWDEAALREMDDDELAQKVLWIASCDFHEYIVECTRAGVPVDSGLETNTGSDIFVLE